MQEVLARRAAAAEAVRARLGAPRSFAYGPAAIERLDVYPTSRPAVPVMVFLHGGAWRGGDARSQAYPAEMFVQAGNVLVTDWPRDFGLPADLVKGGLCISGMYDLRPVRLSARSSYVKFDDRIEHELSPLRHLDRLRAPVSVAYGEHDSPEFQRQSREFAAALQGAGWLRAVLVGRGLNHFEMPETLAIRDGLLGRAALDLLQVARGLSPFPGAGAPPP